MHHLPRIFALKKQSKSMDHDSSSKPKSKSMDLAQSPRKLIRRNAAKNFVYTPFSSSSTSPSASDSSARTRSLDLPHDLGLTSFRVEGNEGEIESICQSLGLNGPEDLEIPKEVYALMKAKLCPDVSQRPKPMEPKAQNEEANKFVESSPHRFGNGIQTNVGVEIEADRGSSGRKQSGTAIPPVILTGAVASVRVGGIKGDRPPLLNPPSLLSPPPSRSVPVFDDGCSTWDLLDQFGPDGQRDPCFPKKDAHFSCDEEEGDGANAITDAANGVRIGETVILSGSCSFTTTNDDDSSSTTTDPISMISPEDKCNFNVSDWGKGELLGRGSFGTVYAGISSEGAFFAVKEVDLLEQGSQGKQSVYQLEQEIALLSQFEHENIVRYLGTEKRDSKLYIFLELVTQGSLLSLYQKYDLRDSHVSNYTRQILLGLKYLHDKNVIHRDIKCANILVASNGMVKLADFGLAKASRLNDLKSCKGTIFWMAPEVVNSVNQGYGVAADIWSLGCTVLEMLTRHIPYYPLEFGQAIYRIGKGEPPSVPESLSRDARDFIQQCLRVNPNDRPTATELLDHPFVRRPLYIPSGSESPMVSRR